MSRQEHGPLDTHVRILACIRRIPRGRVCTYGDVARLARLPRRARLVGFVLRHSPLAEGVPWHRVISSSGRIATRAAADMAEQRRRLIAEGVAVSARGAISLARYRWPARR